MRIISFPSCQFHKQSQWTQDLSIPHLPHSPNCAFLRLGVPLPSGSSPALLPLPLSWNCWWYPVICFFFKLLFSSLVVPLCLLWFFFQLLICFLWQGPGSFLYLISLSCKPVIKSPEKGFKLSSWRSDQQCHHTWLLVPLEWSHSVL